MYSTNVLFTRTLSLLQVGNPRNKPMFQIFLHPPTIMISILSLSIIFDGEKLEIASKLPKNGTSTSSDNVNVTSCKMIKYDGKRHNVIIATAVTILIKNPKYKLQYLTIILKDKFVGYGNWK
jgi:hypothetical protein